MNKKFFLVILMPVLFSGCISRTVSTEQGLENSHSSDSEIIWFWQGAFWNPED
ncbi:hypothetical protein P4C99_16285 [Pontiellaceae bacterium B1224]|nr:hypothetical protein [Pontiellaceae bacterium B1224]